MVKAVKKSTPKPRSPIPTTPPARRSESERLLQLLYRSLRSAKVNGVAGYNAPATASMDAALDFAKAMSHIPPETPTEVLAQASMLFSEARDLALANEWPEDSVKEYSERMARRVLGIALWIEVAFQINREEIGLDLFLPKDRHDKVPMAAPFPSYCHIEWAISRRYTEMGLEWLAAGPDSRVIKEAV